MFHIVCYFSLVVSVLFDSYQLLKKESIDKLLLKAYFMKSSFYKNISAEKGKCNCSDGLHAPNPVSRGMKESHVKT